MRRRTTALVGVAAVVGSLVAGSSVATAAPASAHICIPIIWPCDDPAPSDTPSATPTATASATADPGGSGGAGDANGDGAPGDADTRGDDPGSGTAPDDAGDDGAGGAKNAADSASWSIVTNDDSAVFTQPSAQLGSQSLSFSGLKGIALVKVKLADGSRVTAVRLRADTITISGFSLTVRAETGPKLVTTADQMTLRGDVSVYVNSLTATTPSGKSFTLGADTPPPADGLTPKLLRVTLGLLGSTADEISYSNTDQTMHE
ncbi:hypothetical protein ET475_05395 [Microbacterium protaetiae]|uniref:Uncharacterized protein n=2 Tax=Microbacterium protaetiae TaxID=2509458 RepID=A0A4P6EUL7_9MICO|nr:hypothetical protein ET475_05395 [Microbacterium protaetiae]